MSTQEWRIEAPGNAYTPDEVAQITRAAQAFLEVVSAVGAPKSYHTVRLDALTMDPAANPWARCDCGHLWMSHDIEEYTGDGSEMCCVVGCDQSGCPGKVPRAAAGEPQ